MSAGAKFLTNNRDTRSSALFIIIKDKICLNTPFTDILATYISKTSFLAFFTYTRVTPKVLGQAGQFFKELCFLGNFLHRY